MRKFKNLLAKNFGSLFLVLIAVSGFYYRITYIKNLVGDPNEVDFGGDPAHHYQIAKNIYKGLGPVTNFIFGFWFDHKNIPALSDVYSPGYHYLCSTAFHLFSESPMVARGVNVFFALLTIILVYSVGKKISTSSAAILAAGLLACNWNHIEHSSVSMISVVEAFFFLLGIYLISKSLKSGRGWGLAGLVCGYAVLTRGTLHVLWISLLVTVLLRKLVRKKDLIFTIRDIFFFVLCLLAPLGYWIFLTYSYFGKILYSYSNFYPFVETWTQMWTVAKVPNLQNFLSTHAFSDIFRIYLKCLYNIHLQFSSQFFPYALKELNLNLISVILYFFILSGLYYIRKDTFSRVSLLAIFGYLGFLVLSSPALSSEIYPRYILPLSVMGFLFWSIGLIEFHKYLFDKYNAFNFQIVGPLLVAVLLVFFHNSNIHLFEIEKYSFWKLRSEPLLEVSKWIKDNTKETDRFMYALTPQDFSVFSDRPTVVDPNWIQDKPSFRASEEIRRYHVQYLVIDQDKSIYDRSIGRGGRSLSEIMKNYPLVNYEVAYINESKNIHVLKILGIE